MPADATAIDRQPTREVFPKGMPARTVRRFDGGEFKGFDAASQFCRDHGYSVGAMQADDPIGLLKGEFSISKWRNLNAKEKLELDGTIEGAKRDGPVFVFLREAID